MRRRVRDDAGQLVTLRTPWVRTSTSLRLEDHFEAGRNTGRSSGFVAWAGVIVVLLLAASVGLGLDWLRSLGAWTLAIIMAIAVLPLLILLVGRAVRSLPSGMAIRDAHLAQGLCPSCGYALDHAIERCAECGSVWTSRPSMPEWIDSPEPVSDPSPSRHHLWLAGLGVLFVLCVAADAALLFPVLGVVSFIVALVIDGRRHHDRR